MPPTAPRMAMMMIMSIIEIRKPTTANPRGRLNIPINDNKRPMNQRNTFTPGNQLKQAQISAMTNPAVPTPLDLCSTWVTTTCC